MFKGLYLTYLKQAKYKYFTLFTAGALMALALAPIGFAPILWLSLPILYFGILNSNSEKTAFFTGWLFALGYGVASLYWISFALFVEIDKWWWLVPFALLLLPSVLAIYTAFVSVFLFKLKKYLLKPIGIVIFAIFVFFASYMQGHLLTGFPWNLLGYTWIDASLAVAQNFAWAGIYGITFITILCATTPVIAFFDVAKKQKLAIILIGILIIFAMWLWGTYRLNKVGDTKFNEKVVLRIVQPSIKQQYKWQAEKQLENLNKYLEMSVASDAELKPTHIIWPETALTTDIGRFPEAAEYIRSKLPKGTILMTGNIREDSKGFFNSLLVMDIGTGEKRYFDKTHLVPFGEYIPFRRVISMSAIGSAISIMEDFQKGAGPYLAKFKDIPDFSSLICYEIIFPAEVIDKSKLPPKWILNITNDGWYGNSSGPYQHLAIARARAIENSIPVIRSASTGISAVIDSVGRVVEDISLNDSGIITINLPKMLSTYE